MRALSNIKTELSVFEHTLFKLYKVEMKYLIYNM